MLIDVAMLSLARDERCHMMETHDVDHTQHTYIQRAERERGQTQRGGRSEREEGFLKQRVCVRREKIIKCGNLGNFYRTEYYVCFYRTFFYRENTHSSRVLLYVVVLYFSCVFFIYYTNT